MDNESAPGPLFSSQPPPGIPSRFVAGFWRRLLGFVIDGIILAIPCFILGFSFYDFFAYSPAWEMLVGLVINLLYFSVLNSYVGNGQTLGQRVTGIRVVDENGAALSLERAFLRSLVLFAPLLLRLEVLWPSSSMIATGLSGLKEAAATAIVYLYVFNSRTRQSLHDLAVASFVVEEPGSGKVKCPAFWKCHWAILGGVLVSAGILTTVVMKTGPFSELESIQRAVLESDNVQSATVVLQTYRSGGTSTDGIVLTVVCITRPENYGGVALKLAGIVMKADPRASERDFITVRFQEGFWIGFARFSTTNTQDHSPAEWIKLGSEQSGS